MKKLFKIFTFVAIISLAYNFAKADPVVKQIAGRAGGIIGNQFMLVVVGKKIDETNFVKYSFLFINLSLICPDKSGSFK